MKKKIIAVILASAMLIASLSACGNSGGSSDSGSASSGSSAADTSADAGSESADTGSDTQSDAGAAGGEEITLTIWDWDEAHLNHMTQWYMEKYPNVKIETLVVAATDYFQKFQSAVASGSGVPRSEERRVGKEC